ncbi:glycosyltransferase family 2 protein [Altererythrobacter sp. SALINAS58]|uniref:glycosyltransferase family 2 protein n=1 Tax=Alteripontixanthobacter muriae TaxID=2705546 RepID=UPI0015772333|nr:glycosyltransferase family 2 protein [Alteripontixanthobacter muriae]
MSDEGTETRHATVGVVVPLYNASRTIAATLDSISKQTYCDLKVIVVDDGSSDHSPGIVRRKATIDKRIHLIRQQNAGVAAARNLGAAYADTEFLAFVDADDLWAPNKIELQMRSLQEGSEPAGLVYSWFALIDADDRILSTEYRPTVQGTALADLCSGNFIGNGSSIIVKRSVFEAVNGFDSSLRSQGAQGCEDLMFYLSAAELTSFRVVKRHLVGYRRTLDSMSSDAWQMHRSAEAVLSRFRAKYPEHETRCRAHLDGLTAWLIERSIQARKFRTALEMYGTLVKHNRELAKSRKLYYIQLSLKSVLLPIWLKDFRRRLLRSRYGDLDW